MEEIKYVSPFSTWHLPKKDMTGIPQTKVDADYEHCCPHCCKRLPWMEEEGYEVDGEHYPQLFNESLWSCPDGTTHDYDELHKCPTCKGLSYFRNGCF